MTATGTPPWVRRAGLAAVVLGAACVAVHLTGAGGRDAQLLLLRLAAPPFAVLTAAFAGRAARRAPEPAGRRFWWLFAAGHAVAAVGATVPAAGPLCDLGLLVLTVAALVSLPVRTRTARGSLRLGLDLAAVAVAGAVFLGYFMPLLPVAALAQCTAVLVMVFAVLRLLLAGSSAVSRTTLLLVAASAVVGLVARLLSVVDTSSWSVVFALVALLRTLMLATAVLGGAGPSTTPVSDLSDISRHKLSALLPLTAILAIDGLLVAAWPGRPGAQELAVIGGTVVLNAIVLLRQLVALRLNTALVERLDGSLAALRAAMARDQVLADTGTRLLTAADAGAVHALAVAAGHALLGAGAAVAVLVPEAEDLARLTVFDGGEPTGRVVALPPPVRRALRDGPVQDGGALLLPLSVNARCFGILSVTAAAPGPDVRRALETLRTQLALALDAVALTAELTRRALHDPLTGLGNRALIADRLVQALARARRSGRPVGVLLIDLNGFKAVNDTHGHDCGDELLRAVAARLTHSVRIEDTVGRLGGDEFVVVAEDLLDLASAVTIAERIVAAIDAPLRLSGVPIPASASIGVALSTDASTPDELLRQADAAMYVAKRRRPGTAGAYHVHTAPHPLLQA